MNHSRPVSSRDCHESGDRAGDAVQMSPSTSLHGDIGRKTGPQKALIAFGYAGWASGQVEAELARNDWATAAADADLVFDVKREGVWEAAMTRRPRDQ